MPVDDTGMNSVRPSTSPRMIAEIQSDTAALPPANQSADDEPETPPGLDRLRLRPHVARPRSDQGVGLPLFDGMRDPAGAAGDGEEGERGVLRQLQRLAGRDQGEVD